MRGFNWEHSNSYIMHKLTDLFCLTILFAKFNILASFILEWGKLFMADGEQIVLGKFIEGLLGGLVVRSIANHEAIYTWRESPDHSTELWKYLFLKLITKSFQRLCHGCLDIDILFVKLTAQIRHCFWKIRSVHCVSGDWGFNAMPFLNYNILQDASITELF